MVDPNGIAEFDEGRNKLRLNPAFMKVSFCSRTRGSRAPPIASEALRHIAAFYAIEKEIRGHSAEERRLVRAARRCL